MHLSGRLFSLFIAILMITTTLCAQSADDLIIRAKQQKKAGNREKAKELFLRAAAMHHPAAHHELAYNAGQYNIGKEENLYHFTEAAKGGDSDALSYILNHYFFRRESMATANPQYALQIYKSALKNNPKLRLYEQKEDLEILNKCLEIEPFDLSGFIERHEIKKEYFTYYGTWELAELAAKGGRFGRPDPALTFQLIMRGGQDRLELINAVKVAYKRWKADEPWDFDICNFVIADNPEGHNYCMFREQRKIEETENNVMGKLHAALPPTAGKLLDKALKNAKTFITEKATKEEGHDGSGMTSWIHSSISEQQSSFKDFIRSLARGTIPDTITSSKDWDKELNIVYRKVMQSLKMKPVKGRNYSITAASIRDVQRHWIPYRDSCSQLFSHLQPAIEEKEWKNWLAKVRTFELKEIETLRMD